MNRIVPFILFGLLLVAGGSSGAQIVGSDRQTQENTGQSVSDSRKSYRELALEMMYTRGQSGFLDGYIDPSEYTVGPGDEFEISFVSENQGDISAVVNSRGSLFLKSVGVIELGYISLDKAITKIQAAAKESFRGLDFTVQLKTFRFSRLNIVGQVRQPGTYYVPATWRVSELIELAGGPTENASWRNITVKGYDDEYIVDIVKFTATGDVAANPLVCRGNTVVVPEKSIARGFVSVSGEVMAAGSFEFTGAIPIADYIEFCGGFTGDEANLHGIIYSADGQKRELDVLSAAWNEYKPLPGDNIVIAWKDDTESVGVVSIAGEVLRPGKYEISGDSVTFDVLLRLCGGVTAAACMQRTEIYRLSLKDKAMIPANSFLEQPGASQDDAVVSYLLSLNSRRQSEESILTLINGDSVFIPQKTGLVSVQGAVAYPGLVRYTEGKSAEYYIDLAGGYGFDADPDRVAIVNPVSGGTMPADEAGALFDGEIIMVPRKEKQDNQ